MKLKIAFKLYIFRLHKTNKHYQQNLFGQNMPINKANVSHLDYANYKAKITLLYDEYITAKFIFTWKAPIFDKRWVPGEGEKNILHHQKLRENSHLYGPLRHLNNALNNSNVNEVEVLLHSGCKF